MKIRLTTSFDGDEVAVTTKKYALDRSDPEVSEYLYEEVIEPHEEEFGEVEVTESEEDDNELTWDYTDAEWGSAKEARKALRGIKSEIEALLDDIA